MSFGTAFKRAFSRGVPVIPRASALKTHCKTLRKDWTDKETENLKRAGNAVSARHTKGV